MSVLEQVPDAVTIFLHPGSLEELEQRLEAAGHRDRASRWHAAWKWRERKWVM